MHGELTSINIMGSDREPTMTPCGRKARTLSTTTSCYPYPVKVGEFRKNDYEILSGYIDESWQRRHRSSTLYGKGCLYGRERKTPGIKQLGRSGIVRHNALCPHET